MPPPSPIVELPLMVELVIETVAPEMWIPPPSLSLARFVLLRTTTPDSVRGRPSVRIPAPSSPNPLVRRPNSTVAFERVRFPLLRT